MRVAFTGTIVEVEVNAQHQALDDLNPDDATNFSYKFAFPVYMETFECTSHRNLPWLTSGSQWLDVAADYTGEEFGESTYDYELRVTPISSMPASEEATEGQVNIHDLTEGEVVHVTIMSTMSMVATGDEDNRIGMWASTHQCCHAGQDLLLT